MYVFHFKIVMEIFDHTAHGFLEPFLGNFTFPDNYDMPAKCLKGSDISGIPLFVTADFLLPKPHIGTGFPVAGLPWMAVPETTIHEYDRMIFPEHEIRPTRKPL